MCQVSKLRNIILFAGDTSSFLSAKNCVNRAGVVNNELDN